MADATYLVESAYNVGAKRGLPQVKKEVTINANNATIERSSDEIFHFFNVSSIGSLTLNDVTLLNGGRPEGDDTYVNAGGIFNWGTVVINDSTIRNCRAINGAAILNNNSLTVTNTLFDSNSSDSTSFGGAIDTDTSSSTILTGCTFKNNYAGGGGGAIMARSTLQISESTFKNNTSSDGGAIYTTSTWEPTIDRSSFISNNATVNGGGAIDKSLGILTITNSTFSGNTGPNGGAIRNENGELRVTHSTFSNNSANGKGGAIVRYGNNIYIQNSIFSDNTAGIEGNDYHGTVNSGGGNIISSSAGSNGFSEELDSLNDENIKLGTLIESDEAGQSYYPLLAGSSAINFGIGDNCTDNDQLGNSRETSCSSGAIEPTCGDEIVHALLDEECDAGDSNSDTETDTCRTTCKNPACGDNVVDTGEECDGSDDCENDCTLIVVDEEPEDEPEESTPADESPTEGESSSTLPEVETAATDTETTDDTTDASTTSAAKPSSGCSLIR